MPHTLDKRPDQFSSIRSEDKYGCECGKGFPTYRDWERHSTEEKRKAKSQTVSR